ncbi:MAG TPA: transcriptional regulator, partial [Pelagibacteraceae bacterium]|nr:transcriptional regulator [Pelagibacteraceae bacterium]
QNKENTIEDDLNYSFLAKLFSTLSDKQKEKILQVLKNTRSLEKTG